MISQFTVHVKTVLQDDVFTSTEVINIPDNMSRQIAFNTINVFSKDICKYFSSCDDATYIFDNTYPCSYHDGDEIKQYNGDRDNFYLTIDVQTLTYLEKLGRVEQLSKRFVNYVNLFIHHLSQSKYYKWNSEINNNVYLPVTNSLLVVEIVKPVKENELYESIVIPVQYFGLDKEENVLTDTKDRLFYRIMDDFNDLIEEGIVTSRPTIELSQTTLGRHVITVKLDNLTTDDIFTVWDTIPLSVIQ